jgi:BMFP domain-containing protein YqiC
MLFDLPKQLLQELSQSLHRNSNNNENLSRSQIHSLLEAALRKCQLVSREEFDAQQAVLLRTREKLELLEKEVEALKILAQRGSI